MSDVDRVLAGLIPPRPVKIQEAQGWWVGMHPEDVAQVAALNSIRITRRYIEMVKDWYRVKTID